MTHMLEDESKTYTAIVNHERQFSFWPVDREPPAGWMRAGAPGTRAEVLAYIDATWTDMRPASLQQAMAESQASAQQTT